MSRLSFQSALAIVTILVAVFAAVALASGGDKHRAIMRQARTTDPVPGSESPDVEGFLYVITYVTVTPHRRLAQTFEFIPAFGSFSTLFGGTTYEADEIGRLAGVDRLAMLDPNHEPGWVRGWWREPDTPANAPPVMLDGKPARITLAVP